MDPKTPEVARKLLDHYDETKAFGDMEAVARRTLTLKPDDTEVKLSLARALAGQGKLVEAKTVVTQVISADADLAVAHEQLAQLEDKLGHWPAAKAAYLKAIGLDDGSSGPRMAYARALEIHGELPEAITQYRAALEADDSSDTYLSLAKALYKSGQKAEAKKVLLEAAKHYDDDEIKKALHSLN